MLASTSFSVSRGDPRWVEARAASYNKVSASFFGKKEAKKLPLTAGVDARVPSPPGPNIFCVAAGPAFFKKAALPVPISGFVWSKPIVALI
jgi:hypothetical protein